MTEDEVRKKQLPGSDVYIRSQLAYKDSVNNASFVAYLNGEALLAFKNTLVLMFDSQMQTEGTQLTDWFKNGRTGAMPQSPYTFRRLLYINIENLLIGSAFELHFKAELVRQGYVIQEISNNPKFLDLRKKQLERPLSKDDFLSVEGYVYDETRKLNRLRGLSNKSIGFSTLLKQSYLELIDAPTEIKELAEYYNKLRNQIHMPGDALELMPPEKYQNASFVEDLKDYINSAVVGRTNIMIIKNGLPITARLHSI